jgi:hypothetical protein
MANCWLLLKLPGSTCCLQPTRISVISKILRGVGLPSLYSAIRICRWCDCTYSGLSRRLGKRLPAVVFWLRCRWIDNVGWVCKIARGMDWLRFP